MTYEEAFRRLEEIARTLEAGEIELAESVKLYEEAKNLLALCDRQLKDAEQRVTTVTTEEKSE